MILNDERGGYILAFCPYALIEASVSLDEIRVSREVDFWAFKLLPAFFEISLLVQCLLV